MRFRLLIAAIAAAFTAQVGATVVGDSVDAAMYRTVGTDFYPAGRLLGYGLDGPFVVQDGISDLKTYSSAFTLDVNSNDFTIRFLNQAGWQNGSVFRLTDLDFDAAGDDYLSNLIVDSNFIGYGLTINPHSIEIDFSNTRFTASTYFTGRFVVTQVPEPSSLALFALGMAAVSLTRRRSRHSATSRK